MLRKFITIKNVGRFEAHSAIGGSQFCQLTSIYGENGRGKTTLCAILRSLQKNDPRYIKAKHTLGAADAPHVELLFNPPLATTRTFIFKNSNWNKSSDAIQIFDSEFINQNVYSGDRVDVEHRRNLFYFAVGATGVSLAKKLDDLDSAIKAKTGEISEQQKALDLVKGNLNLSQFVSLPYIADIDSEITNIQKTITNLSQQSKIANHTTPQNINLPTLDIKDIKELLLKQMLDISRNAEAVVKDQISKKRMPEKWIQDGIKYLLDNQCPFCEANISSSTLIEAYRDYFNKAYTEFKQTIASKLDEFEKSRLTEKSVNDLELAVKANQADINFWQDYAELENPSLNLQELREIISALRKKIIDLLRIKKASPLDAVLLPQETESLWAQFKELQDKISLYNLGIEAANLKIVEFKSKIGVQDLDTEKKQLLILELTKKRFTSEVDLVCSSHSNSVNSKKALEKEKREAKAQLDQYTEKILVEYQHTINDYLTKFGAGFKIVETSGSYLGGKAGSKYLIELNNHRVEPGGSSGQPSFGTVLSDGDKNALAFAFFVSSLEHDQFLADKIVVIDDPVNSMDLNRTDQTCHAILNLVAKAKQVLVLSHNLSFLTRLNSITSHINDQACFKIQRGNNDQSTISEWVLEKDSQSAYMQDYNLLYKFREGGSSGTSQELLGVVRCLRPFLEQYLRWKYPLHFSSNKWIGDYLGVLRDATQKDPYFDFKQNHYKNITAINDYSSRYHHANNAPTGETPTDGELMTFVQMAFKVIEG